MLASMVDIQLFRMPFDMSRNSSLDGEGKCVISGGDRAYRELFG
jgi:hypothetical protein